MFVIGNIGVAWGVLFAVAGRLLDLVSTWLATPTLEYEGNRRVRRRGWRHALISSLIFPVVGYAMPFAGVVLGTLCFLISLDNMRLVFTMRCLTLPVQEAYEKQKLAMYSCDLRTYVLYRIVVVALPALCFGFLILASTGFSDITYATGVGYGMLAWCVTVACLRLENRLMFRGTGRTQNAVGVRHGS